MTIMYPQGPYCDICHENIQIILNDPTNQFPDIKDKIEHDPWAVEHIGPADSNQNLFDHFKNHHILCGKCGKKLNDFSAGLESLDQNNIKPDLYIYRKNLSPKNRITFDKITEHSKDVGCFVHKQCN